MYEKPQTRMYETPKAWAWQPVATNTARYASVPVFEPPQPPAIFLPPNPFEPLPEPPNNESEGVQTEADAPLPEEDQSAGPGKYIFVTCDISR